MSRKNHTSAKEVNPAPRVHAVRLLCVLEIYSGDLPERLGVSVKGVKVVGVFDSLYEQADQGHHSLSVPRFGIAGDVARRPGVLGVPADVDTDCFRMGSEKTADGVITGDFAEL